MMNGMGTISSQEDHLVKDLSGWKLQNMLPQSFPVVKRR